MFGAVLVKKPSVVNLTESIKTFFCRVRNSQPKFSFLDFVLAVILGATAFVIISNQRDNVEGVGDYYQQFFAPAVLEACGKPFLNPRTEIESLTQFLARKTEVFDCSEIPSNLEFKDLNSLQLSQAHLYKFATWIWKIRGIKWKELEFIGKFFFALNGILFYLIFRIGMGRVLSAIATLILINSTLQFDFVPHLRDFSKSTFILFGVFAIGLFTTRKLQRKKQLLFAGITGVLLGVGVGFRIDVIVMAPLFLVLVPFYKIAPELDKKNLQRGLLAVCFIVGFVITTAPVLSRIHGTSNSSHVIVLGLMSHFDDAIGVLPADHSYGYKYNDTYVSQIFSQVNDRKNLEPIVYLGGPEYQRVGQYYLLNLLMNFPGDFVSRFLAASYKIFELNIHVSDSYIWAFLLVLIVTAFVNWRYSIIIFVVYFYLSGYTMLQFSPRHYFHLEFVGLWILALGLSYAGKALLCLVIGEKEKGASGRADSLFPFKSLSYILVTRKQAIWVLVVFALALIIPAWLTRSYQESNVSKIVEELKKVSLKPIPVSAVEKNGLRIFRYSFNADANNGYVVVDFDSSRCESDVKDFVLSYAADTDFNDHTREVLVPWKSEEPSHFRYFFRVFRSNLNEFIGVEVQSDTAECFSVYRPETRVNDIPLIDYRIPLSKGSTLAFYQIPTFEKAIRESDKESFDVFFLGVPVKNVNKKLFLRHKNGVSIGPSDIAHQYQSVKLDQNGWSIRDKAREKYSYILSTSPKTIKEGGMLVVKGYLLEGGITVGLLRNEQWHLTQNITHEGPFIVGFGIAEKDAYQLVIANMVSKKGKNVEATIDAVRVYQ